MAIHGDSRRFVAIRGDLLISDTPPEAVAQWGNAGLPIVDTLFDRIVIQFPAFYTVFSASKVVDNNRNKYSYLFPRSNAHL